MGRLSPEAFSFGIGLPLSLDERGQRLLPGTYSGLGLAGESQRRKLQCPDFIRAYVSTVVMVIPDKRLRLHPGLVLDKFRGPWYLLRKVKDLKGARTIAGLAITSPARVFSTLGRTLRGLSSLTPDQFHWLRSSWKVSERSSRNLGGSPKIQDILDSWRGNTSARRSLATAIEDTFQTLPGSSGLSCGGRKLWYPTLRSSTR